MKYTIKQFRAEFPDDESCLNKIMEMQYGGTEFECPHCKKASKFHRIATRRAYACQFCGHHVYPCVGTPFEKSRTPLTDWFYAMYLFTATRNGVAAKELERQIGCTYKTAWRMAKELRKLMAQADDHESMSGHVEMDEAYVGGKNKRNKPSNKTTVFGMIQRGGQVRAGVVKNAATYTLEPYILKNIEKGSTVSTDMWRGYQFLSSAGYKHGTVNHSAKQWVKGEHHTNTIENFWSHMKRSIRGTHIHVSKRHMWKYVAEFAYRFNYRDNPRYMSNRLVLAFALPRLADD